MRQVAEQTELLLFVAHKLPLQPLVLHMHNFLYSSLCCIHDHGCIELFDGPPVHMVFTDRVYEAATSGLGMTKELFLSSVLSRPGSFADAHGCPAGCTGHVPLLRPVGEIKVGTHNRLHCPAQLQQPFLGWPAGERMNVVLDLFDSGAPTIGLAQAGVSLPAQLLLGSAVQSIGDLDKLFPDPAHPNA